MDVNKEIELLCQEIINERKSFIDSVNFNPVDKKEVLKKGMDILSMSSKEYAFQRFFNYSINPSEQAIHLYKSLVEEKEEVKKIIEGHKTSSDYLKN